MIGLLVVAIPAYTQEPNAAPPDHVADLVLHAADLVYRVDDMGGKIESLEVKETSTEVRIDLSADVLFAFDQADLLPKARQTLSQAAAIIRDKAKGTVRIDGYTDAKGSDPYNQRLSERRAAAVENWFKNDGHLNAVSFAAKGFGARNPVAPNTRPDGSDDPDGRQKNRRVEITITKG
jgi:outer membrane protein OmpA-like peptidoglycan-associated protein